MAHYMDMVDTLAKYDVAVKHLEDKHHLSGQLAVLAAMALVLADQIPGLDGIEDAIKGLSHAEEEHK